MADAVYCFCMIECRRPLDMSMIRYGVSLTPIWKLSSIIILPLLHAQLECHSFMVAFIWFGLWRIGVGHVHILLYSAVSEFVFIFVEVELDIQMYLRFEHHPFYFLLSKRTNLS